MWERGERKEEARGEPGAADYVGEGYSSQEDPVTGTVGSSENLAARSAQPFVLGLKPNNKITGYK